MWATINVIMGIGLACWCGYLIYLFVTDYMKEQGPVWQRLLVAGKNSATILWARFQLIVTTAVGAIATLASYLDAPGVGDAIKSAIKPEYVLVAAIIIPLVSEWARRRTL
jgi:hypothetical protein